MAADRSASGKGAYFSPPRWCTRPRRRRACLLGCRPRERDAEGPFGLAVTPDHAPAIALRRTRRAISPPAAPAPIPGAVPRTRLLRRLTACRETPVVLIVAPPGYGK